MPVDQYEVSDGYKCPTCDKVLPTSLGLKQHHTKVHDESLVDTAECKWCGDTFQVRPSQVGNFCSRKCHMKHRSEHGVPAARRQVTITCKGCGEDFSTARSYVEYGKKYCSKECHVNDRNGAMVDCEICGDKFYAYDTYADKARFCSQDCYGVWLSENKSGPNSPHWRGGKVGHEVYGPGWGERKRSIVRERDGHECVDCGMTQAEHLERHDMKLHVHHEIPARDSTNPAVYNAPRNLRTLCIPCHMAIERAT